MDQDLIAYLAAMEQRLEQRFDAMEKRSDAMEQRFDGMEQRFDGMEQRFDGMEQRFDGMEQRSDAMEQRFDGMEQHFSQEIQDLRQDVRHVHVVVEGIQDKIQLAAEGIMNVNEKLDRHREEVSGRFNDLESLMRDSDRALASRVLKIEQKLKMAV